MKKISLDQRLKLFLLLISCLALTAFIVIKNGQKPVYRRGSSASYDLAISSAITLYKRMAPVMDLSEGPCLSNDLMPDWVVDIVHTPREEIDKLPANQCQAYLEGRAHHFVELDLSGNLVRIR